MSYKYLFINMNVAKLNEETLKPLVSDRTQLIIFISKFTFIMIKLYGYYIPHLQTTF